MMIQKINHLKDYKDSFLPEWNSTLKTSSLRFCILDLKYIHIQRDLNSQYRGTLLNCSHVPAREQDNNDQNGSVGKRTEVDWKLWCGLVNIGCNDKPNQFMLMLDRHLCFQLLWEMKWVSLRSYLDVSVIVGLLAWLVYCISNWHWSRI